MLYKERSSSGVALLDSLPYFHPKSGRSSGPSDTAIPASLAAGHASLNSPPPLERYLSPLVPLLYYISSYTVQSTIAASFDFSLQPDNCILNLSTALIVPRITNRPYDLSIIP